MNLSIRAALILSVLFLSACTTTRTLPEWEGQPIDVSATRPLPRCQWPDLTPDGKVTDLVALENCRDTAEGDRHIAQANAEAIEELVRLHNLTEDQARRYIELAEFQLTEMDQDRREAVIEVWIYKSLFALALVGSLL